MRWFLILALTVQQAGAVVLVQAPGVPLLDYKAALKADSEAVSPTQHALKARPSSGARDNLLALFASAQKSFLGGSPEEASAQFQKVTALLTAEDWPATDRRVFLQSYLRLAQLEPANQGAWLNKALSAGDDVQPEADLFPPPLIAELKRLRREVPRTAPAASEEWTEVLFNGSPAAGWPLNGEAVRVTFLSDVWKPETHVVKDLDVKRLAPAKLPLASGGCAQSKVDLKNARAFWGLDCEAAPRELNLQPVFASPAIPKLDIKEKSPAFYKSKWFWGTVAVAAVTAVVIASQKKKDSNPEPTMNYGYK